MNQSAAIAHAIKSLIWSVKAARHPLVVAKPARTPEMMSEAEWAARVAAIYRALPPDQRPQDLQKLTREQLQFRREFNDYGAGRANPALRESIDQDWRDTFGRDTVPTQAERIQHRNGSLRYRWDRGLQAIMENTGKPTAVFHDTRQHFGSWDTPMLKRPAYRQMRQDQVDFDELLHPFQPNAPATVPAKEQPFPKLPPGVSDPSYIRPLRAGELKAANPYGRLYGALPRIRTLRGSAALPRPAADPYGVYGVRRRATVPRIPGVPRLRSY